MCGITGWVDYEHDLSTEAEVLQAMTDTMACRGPDAQGVWLSRHAGLGHRRLAVIDIPGGVQPMSAGRPQAVVTFSGEIYNFRELRRELESRGHVFRTRSDTEVLLRCYLQWGADCVHRLNGMFAFAIWDEGTQELLLARDRLGVKPLFYTEHAGGVMFGSEPKALLAHPLVSCEMDDEGAALLLSEPGIRPPGEVLYRGIAEVRPGWTVRVTRESVRRAAYWTLAARPHTDDLPTTIATVRELLEDIVERQLISDVPLGTLLSGGVDSSAITALAARTVQRQGWGKLSSFSVDFQGHETDFRPDRVRPSRDEPFVRMAAEHIGSRHTTVLLDVPDIITAEGIAIRAWDAPNPAGNMDTSMYLLFDELRRHCTVALSGESADEVFGGYHWYHDENLLTAPTFPWAAGGPQLAALLHDDVRDRLRLTEYQADRYADGLRGVARVDGETGRDRRIREILHLGLTHWLPLLLDRKDRLSMAVGLEVRVPFCDHRLVEYVYNVPWSIKTTGGIEKGLLRSAVADLLPPEVAQRPKSIYPGIRNPAYDQAISARMRELLAQPDAPLFQLVDPVKVSTMLAAGVSLPGMWSAVAPLGWAAYLLAINEWLVNYRVRLV